VRAARVLRGLPSRHGLARCPPPRPMIQLIGIDGRRRRRRANGRSSRSGVAPAMPLHAHCCGDAVCAASCRISPTPTRRTSARARARGALQFAVAGAVSMPLRVGCSVVSALTPLVAVRLPVTVPPLSVARMLAALRLLVVWASAATHCVGRRAAAELRVVPLGLLLRTASASRLLLLCRRCAAASAVRAVV
jgi:hypothetical protein